MRGKREKTKSIGIMRIDITASCKSRVLRVRWLTLSSSFSCSIGSSALARCSIIACVITSSPTRLISWSTFSIETRIDDDSAPALSPSFLAGFFSCSASATALRHGRRGGSAGVARLGRVGANLFEGLEETVALFGVALHAGGGADILERLEEAITGVRRALRGRRAWQRVEETVALGFFLRRAGRFGFAWRQWRRLRDHHVVRIEHERADGQDVVQAFMRRHFQHLARVGQADTATSPSKPSSAASASTSRCSIGRQFQADSAGRRHG